MSISKLHPVAKREPKMIKTSIVGYCYGCQSIHYKEETVREDGVLYCKGTGRTINTECYEKPDPIEARETDFYEWAFEGAGSRDLQEPSLSTRAEQIAEHMADLADLFGIDTETHREHWDALVCQVVALAEAERQP